MVLSGQGMAPMVGPMPLPEQAASIDGTGNNTGSPEWGSTSEALLRLAPIAYADGISTPAGSDRPGAREVSNAVAAHPEEELKNDRNLTALVYAWGQFLDHDLDLTLDGGASFGIPVPASDALFDPQGTGTKLIPFTRAAGAQGTGTDASNPLQHLNLLTAFLDGSQVYGSDAERAAALRTFSGGKLRTSDGDMLPLNTDGLLNANIPGGTPDAELFLAGDIRANENIELLSLHTLFVREHNRVADRIAASAPGQSDEQIYQKARRYVIAEMQAITYNEFLPALLGEGALRAYQGYDPRVNPGISAEFSTAAYRIGHTMVGNDVEFLDNEGNETREVLPLSQAFFNPNVVKETGIDPILKYLATDLSEEVDTRVVDGLRNMLFGPPGAGGLDLAAMNIQRGRDLGLADYNTTRAAYGLPRVSSFSEITSDLDLQAALEQVYGSVDSIDLWVGGLAEDHLPGSSVGATFTRILVDQFERIRAGDRYWYENLYGGAERDALRNTRLSDLIERNTNLTTIQPNAFYDPFVLYYKTPEGPNAAPVEVRIEGATVRIRDGRSGAMLAEAGLEATSQVIVVGARTAPDRIVLDVGRATSLPSGGLQVHGGQRGPDELVVIGTTAADQVDIGPDRVIVNRGAASIRGFEALTVRAEAGNDRITVGPAVRADVTVYGGPGEDTVTGARKADRPPPVPSAPKPGGSAVPLPPAPRGPEHDRPAPGEPRSEAPPPPQPAENGTGGSTSTPSGMPITVPVPASPKSTGTAATPRALRAAMRKRAASLARRPARTADPNATRLRRPGNPGTGSA